jgi:hypothetical protein
VCALNPAAAPAFPLSPASTLRGSTR